jgi:hypothetical protein
MVWNAGSHPPLPFGLPGNPENRYHSSQLGDHPANPGLMVVVVVGGAIDVWREKKLM